MVVKGQERKPEFKSLDELTGLLYRFIYEKHSGYSPCGRQGYENEV